MLMLVRGTITGAENCQMELKAVEGAFLIKYASEDATFLQNFKNSSRVLVDIPLLSTEFECQGNNKKKTRFSMTKYSDMQGTKTIIYNESIKIYKETYDCINALRQDKYTNIIAFCGGFKPLIKTKGTDSLFSLILKDQTGTVDLKVFIKENDFKMFNAIGDSNKIEFNVGDILCLQNVKLGKNSSTALIHRACDIRKILRYKNCVDNKMYENYVAQYLDSYFKVNLIQDICDSPKTIRIEQIREKLFFNILAKVLHMDNDIFPTICITDFTMSPLNCNTKSEGDCNIVDGNRSDVPTNNTLKTNDGNLVFPNGMVLVLKLFGKHIDLFKKIKKNVYYLFMNIRIHSFAPCMEAYMHDSLEGNIIPVKDRKFLKEIQSRENTFYNSKDSLRNQITEDKLNDVKKDDICNNRNFENSAKTQEISILEQENSLNSGKNHEVDNKLQKFNINKTGEESNICAVKSDSCQNSTKKLCLTDTVDQDCSVRRPDECSKDAISLSKLKQIMLPGIYLSKCLIRDFVTFGTDSGRFANIIVEEDASTFTLISKLKLTQKLLDLQNQFLNREFKCLVLRNSDKKFFMVDLFFNDEQFSTFENFYLSS